MDFSHSPKVVALVEKLADFMGRRVLPNEALYDRQTGAADGGQPGIMEELKEEAHREGLWNLFWPNENRAGGAGLNNVDYAPLAEIMGHGLWAPEVFNCNAPDTGNMEILAEFGNEAQRREWLEPLLEGKIRSCFSMTEPDTAGSDPTQLAVRAVREGEEYVIDGRKWFATGAYHPNCKVAIVMAVTDPEAPKHGRASMLLVPLETPGLRLHRTLPVFGHTAGPGHGEIIYDNCRVPAANLLGVEGGGFTIAQARLGPGRIHHCMRGIGGAERALELMCRRALSRWAHGGHLADKGLIQSWIAECRLAIEQARLLVLHAAWKIDTQGKKAARQEISMVKTVVANMFQQVCDKAIQVHGALGTTDDVPLAQLWNYARIMRLADGPDEVHNMVVARRELARYKKD